MRGITLIGLFTILGFGLYWVREYKKKTAALEDIIHGLTDCSKEMKETLVAGLVYRFGATPGTEQPLKFERFVAKVLRLHYGGKTSVSQVNSNIGIDILHRRGQNTYLGLAKCLEPDFLVDYQPIAIVHSQMLKAGATGGFVATTSDFTNEARKYARETNVDLIDGGSLVELWTYSLAKSKERRELKRAKEA